MPCRWQRAALFKARVFALRQAQAASPSARTRLPCATPSPNCPASKIREVANAGIGRSDVLAFWFGESDEVTPEAVRRAAAQSLLDGETFYSHNLGLPELRAGAGRLLPARCTAPVDVERIAVTSSGVNALMLAMQMLAGAGDEVVAVVPLWPNLTAQAAIMGATVRRIALRPRHGRWSLDLDELRAAVTPATRVLLLNAPNNPTGWTLTRDEQQAILGALPRAPAPGSSPTRCTSASTSAPAWRRPASSTSPRDEDRLVVAHSFSKSFLMTGWRLGWLVLPRGHLDAIGKLIEFNTSCAPVFVQRGGLAALADRARLRARRWCSACAPAATGWSAAWRRCRASRWPARRAACMPSSASQGQADSLAFAKHLVDRARPGPGARRGLRRRGRRLAALVLRLARPAAARRRGAAPGRGACPIIHSLRAASCNRAGAKTQHGTGRFHL